MWKATSVVIASSLLFACGSSDSEELSNEAVVLSFSIQGEVGKSQIESKKNQILVQVAEEKDLAAAVLNDLKLSPKASASIQKGSKLDLSSKYSFTVTAEDGTERVWNVLGSAKNSEVDPDKKPEPQPDDKEPGEEDPDDKDPGEEDPDDKEPEDDGLDPTCPTRVATYDLSGVFEITDTTGNLGNAKKDVGPGKIQLRFINRTDGTTDVRLLSYELAQKFEVGPSAATVSTNVMTSVEANICGKTEGSLDAETQIVSWAECNYTPTGETKWSSENIQGGPGCMNGYHSQGTITCKGFLCFMAGVDFPINQDETYAQPLNWFEFNEDLSQFTMNGLGAPELNAGRNGVEVPSAQPSRTWLSLTGTEVSSKCEPLPAECK